jgi:hypothetical protein
MAVSVEKKDLVVAGAGTIGSYGVGVTCQFGVSKLYQPLVTCTHLFQDQCADASQGVIGGADIYTILLGHRQTSSFADQIEKVVHVSREAGVRSAFWAGTVETGVNFFRSWKSKESRPLVVDMIEGGMRGSVIGMVTGACGSNEGPKAVQIFTGAGIGCAAGMVGACFGNLSGYFAKRFLCR